MVVSKETREKQSISRKGKKQSDSMKIKLSEKRKGENNPMYGKRGPLCPSWKGGVSFEPYCEKFNDEFRERVRKFFNHTCQICGHIWQPGEKRLSVHHVNYRKDSCCNEIFKPLFVPLCSGKCHTKTNHNREYWETYFTKIINENYNGVCYIGKE
jgi:hypothetical protein